MSKTTVVRSRYFPATRSKTTRKSTSVSTNKRTWRASQRHSRTEPTRFQQSVYDLISTIPKGQVSTYGAVARVLKSSPRAVGNALRNNPFAPKVPCHRVVASTRELYGFDGQSGPGAPKLIKKKKMLMDEGVQFDGETRVAEESMFDFA